MSRPLTILRPLVALVAVALGTVVLAAPAQAATYSVTLSASQTDRDLGEVLTLTGKVSGSSAAGKKLTVQRQLGAGTWKTIGYTRTTSKKTYTYKHTVSKLGGQSFRVIAPTSGSTKTGISPTRSITGWNWLNLTDQPSYVVGPMLVGATAEVDDDTYDHSLVLFSGSGKRSIGWTLNGLCDDGELDFALYDGVAGTQTVSIETDDGGVNASIQAGFLQGYHVVSPASVYLELSVNGTSSAVQVATPRVHCTVPRLPDPSL